MFQPNNRFRILIDGLILAIQFLSVIPLNKSVYWDRERARMSVITFPVVGILLGLLLVLQLVILKNYSPFSMLAIAFWLFSFSIFFSGGLHLDGWMDCSDAYFSFRDKERRLDIMKDSRVGAFGVLSVIFLLSWRFLFFYEVVQMNHEFVYVFVFMIPVLSRMIMGMLLIHGKLARNEGMAYSFREHVRSTDSVYYSLYVIVCFLAIGFILSFQFALFSIILVIGSLLFYLIYVRFVAQQFGGVTGDLIGASVEGGEAWLWLIVWLLLYFDMG